MMCVLVMLYGGPVLTRVARLTSTSLSLCENEWFGATLAATSDMAMGPILAFMGIQYRRPMVILCDNKAACMLSDSDHTTRRMRHVATRLAYLQEQVKEENVRLVHINTEANLADLGTKPLIARILHYLSSFIWTN